MSVVPFSGRHGLSLKRLYGWVLGLRDYVYLEPHEGSEGLLLQRRTAGVL